MNISPQSSEQAQNSSMFVLMIEEKCSFNSLLTKADKLTSEIVVYIFENLSVIFQVLFRAPVSPALACYIFTLFPIP